MCWWGGICLWLLPDVGGLYDDRFETYICWFLGAFVVWPGYVALNVPGLPWISPLRAVVGLLVINFLFNYATSSYARHEVAKSMRAVPVLNRLFWAFWFLTTVTLVMSPNLGASLTKYVNNQIFWTMMFPLAALVGRREGMIQRSATILVVTAIIVACLAINEYRVRSVIWVDYLPSWLRADEEIMAAVQEAQARAGTDGYRVRGPQIVSLYFAEHLSMLFPLVVHYAYRTPGIFRGVAMALAVFAMMCAMYLTGSRSAMIGIMLTLVIYVFFAAVRKRQESPTSITAMATLLTYPVTVGVVAAIVVFWQRARVAVLGGGQHQSSGIARDVQWDHGWSLIAANPFGYGLDRSAEVLGFRTADGQLTIDSYYLSVMLDFGLLALPIFVMLFTMPMWYALISLKKAKTEELQLIVPLAIGLFNFVVIKAVLSSISNFPLAFVMMGFMVALVARMESNEGASETEDNKGEAAGAKRSGAAKRLFGASG